MFCTNKKYLGEFEIYSEDEICMLKEKVSMFASYTHISLPTELCGVLPAPLDPSLSVY